MGSSGGSGDYKKQSTMSKEQQSILKEVKKEMQRSKLTRSTSRRAIRDIMEGKDGPTTSLKDLQKDYENLMKYSKKTAAGIFDPIRKQAAQDFERESLPTIFNQFGSNSKSSSALNQALASAAKDLQLGLAAQLSPLEANIQTGLAGNLLQLREQNKLNTLQGRLGAAGQGLGLGMSQAVGSLSAQPYAFMQQGPSMLGKLGTAGATGAGAYIGGAAGGAAGGPMGALAGASVGNMIGNALF